MVILHKGVKPFGIDPALLAPKLYYPPGRFRGASRLSGEEVHGDPTREGNLATRSTSERDCGGFWVWVALTRNV